MEIVQRIPIDLEELANLLPASRRSPPDAPRDHSVWHVTNLLQSQQLIIRGDHRYSESLGVPPTGIMSMGRIWEFIADIWATYYSRKSGGMFIPNVCYTRDGILASFDGVLYLPSIAPEPIIWESKLRFTAADSIPDSHLSQGTCYCAIYETCFIAFAQLRIGSKPPTAVAEVIVVHIPHQQRDELWSGVVKTKEYLESLGIRPGGKPQ